MFIIFPAILLVKNVVHSRSKVIVQVAILVFLEWSRTLHRHSCTTAYPAVSQRKDKKNTVSPGNLLFKGAAKIMQHKSTNCREPRDYSSVRIK